MKSVLHTTDPIALRYLMTETLFAIEDGDVPTAAELQDDTVVAVIPADRPGEAEERAPVVRTAPVFSFLGENKQGYLFVTHDPQSDYMSAPAMEAFTKTLAARNLAQADVAVFNLAQHGEQVVISDLVSFFKPRAVILLGPAAPMLGIPALAFNTVGAVGDVAVFQTYSFDVLIQDAEKKSTFWPVLKSLLV